MEKNSNCCCGAVMDGPVTVDGTEVQKMLMTAGLSGSFYKILIQEQGK